MVTVAAYTLAMDVDGVRNASNRTGQGAIKVMESVGWQCRYWEGLWNKGPSAIRVATSEAMIVVEW